MFERDPRNLADLTSLPTADERWHVCDILFAILFHVLLVGSTIDELAHINDTLSHYLESEWQAVSQDLSADSQNLKRSGPRNDRYQFSIRACSLYLLFLEAKPAPSAFLRNITSVCGSAQGCAAWILCTMVNSYCDRIRGIGVRCIAAYLEFTGRHPDTPLALADAPAADDEITKPPDSRSIQENTMTLISNVGQGFMNTNVAKGLAAIGPTMRSKIQTSAKLTSRVSYKLLWHLLKSHKYRIDTWTQAALVAMVFERKSYSSLFSTSFLKENFVAGDKLFNECSTINWVWFQSTLQDASVPLESSIRGELGLNTLMRLMRFLPNRFIDQWLSNLVRVSTGSTAVIQDLSLTADWQPCTFQLSSELAEKIAASTSGAMNWESEMGGSVPTVSPEVQQLADRLDLSLELHSILLANLFRHGEEKALVAIEDAASLQRVCLNGQQILLLILTKLVANLSTLGVLSLDKVASVAVSSEKEETRILLKRSARLVTDTILSNTTKGITMPIAVNCWRSLRHLTAVVVAMSTRLGYVCIAGIASISASGAHACFLFQV